MATTTGGAGLGIAGQACFAGGWLLAFAGLVGDGALGLAASVAGVIGIVLTAIAGFLEKPRLGGLGPGAAWTMIGGTVAALLVFVAIPGSGEWGKLGAFIFALGVLAVTLCVGHLLLAIGIAAAASRPMGIAAAAAIGVAALLAVASTTGGAKLWLAACVAMLAGHVLLLVGFAMLRARAA